MEAEIYEFVNVTIDSELYRPPPATNASWPEDREVELFNIIGPVRESLTTVVPMTVVYSVILLTGTVGNLCTCTVIARNKYMHTATNFYLFSLAVSDLLLLVLGLPQELYMLWQRYPYVFGECFCILRGWTSETSTNASILTITAFTVERYLAICRPLRAHTMSHLGRAIKSIFLIWALAALCAVPLAWQLGIIYLVSHNGSRLLETSHCAVKRVFFAHSFEVSTLVFFVIPISVISVLYVLIGVHLRKNCSKVETRTVKRELTLLRPNRSAGTSGLAARGGSTSSNAQLKQNQSRRTVVKMLVAVVVSFFICWSPFHAQRILATNITTPTPPLMAIYHILTYVSGVTYYLSATVNPILYQLMSRKFRIAFKDTFGDWLACICLKKQVKSNFGHQLTACNFLRHRSQHQHWMSSKTLHTMKVERQAYV